MQRIIRKLDDLIPYDKDCIWVFAPGIVVFIVVCFLEPERINKVAVALLAFLALFALFIYLIAPED
jgi:NADH:ubiquinone oxidoreductase subunit H